MNVSNIEYIVNEKGEKTKVIIPYIVFEKFKASLEKKDASEYMTMAEESMKEIWDNKEDEKEWRKYL